MEFGSLVERSRRGLIKLRWALECGSGSDSWMDKDRQLAIAFRKWRVNVSRLHNNEFAKNDAWVTDACGTQRMQYILLGRVCGMLQECGREYGEESRRETVGHNQTGRQSGLFDLNFGVKTMNFKQCSLEMFLLDANNTALVLAQHSELALLG